MIYLFDKDERLIKLVKKDAIKSALQKFTLTTDRYVSDRLTVEMLDLTAQELEQVEYMAIQSIDDAHKFHFFYIAQKFSEKLTTLIGVQSGIEELRKSVVLDKRPQNTFARPVINDLLAGTNWQARFVSETSQRSTNFYYISTFEALKKVCDVWNLEMQFFVEMNGNKIGARYIDFKKRIGEATGKRVVYGHNALQILQEVERTNLFTALIGRGKGEEVSASNNEGGQAGYGRRLNFENVVWEKSKGAPVDKPKGQKYVELPEMTKKYGIKNADGTMRAKIGFVVFQEEEDANVLIRRTYEQLVNASRPQLTLKTSTVYLKNVNIGDTIRVVRHDKKLDYDTRIFEITFNRLNDESSDIKLGDRISESNEAKIQNIASQKADELISSSFNGLIKNLPDFLPSADGLNKNWYGANDPTKTHAGKVGINDIWFKPNPEHEGQTIMLRWTGEVWEEIIRSNSDQEIIDEISKRFENLNLSGVDEAKAKAEEALKQAGTSSDLAEQVKGLVDTTRQNLDTFKKQAYSQFITNAELDGALSTAQTELKKYVREETDEKTSAIRETITNGFVAKSTYLENVEGINQRFETLKRDNEAKLADYKQGIDGRFANIASQMAGKVNQIDFQRVRETAQLYERILGNTDYGIADNVARMAMTSQLFQVEVAKNVGDSRNFVRNADFREGSKNWTLKATNGLNINFNHSITQRKQTGAHIYGQVTNSTSGLEQKIKITSKSGSKITLSLLLSKDGEARFSGLRIGLQLRNNNSDISQVWKDIQNSDIPWEKYKRLDFTFDVGSDIDEVVLKFYGEQGKTINLYISEVKLETGSQATSFTLAPEDTEEAVKTVQTQLSNSWSVKVLNGPGDVLGAINLNPDGSVKINEGLLSIGEKTYIKDGVIKKSMIGNAQIGTAHIGEIDANIARLINVSAKNIVAEGLTANIIRGGKLSSLNGQSDFDLQTGWLEMNQAGVGIKNQFAGRPLQYLVFGQGSLYGKPGSYTALMSNSRGEVKMNDASAGIQIWNTPDNTTAVNVYGDRIDFMYNANDPLSIGFDTIHNTIENVEDIGLKGKSLATVLNDIFWNFRVLSDGGANLPYHFFKYWNGDK